MPQRHRILTATALALWTLVVFSSALSAGLLNWDDPLYLAQYPPALDLDWVAIFRGQVAANYQPLSVLSLAVEHRLFGMNPFVFHLTNVLLHVANTLLVAVLVRRLLAPAVAQPGREWVALACAALFAVHPLHVESVAWISERKDVLSVFFYLLSLLAYLWYARAPSPRRYAAVAVALGAALLAKPMAVTAPLVMLGFDAYLRRRPSMGMWLEKLPLFAAAIAAGVANLAIQAPGTPGDVAVYAGGLAGRLGLGVESLVFYLAKTLWPARLAAVYDAALVHVGAGEVALALGLVGLLAVWAWRSPDARRPAALAAGFFLVTIAPVLKVIPFGSHSLFNDRYMYLPSVGLFLLLALPFRNAPAWGPRRRALALAGWAIVLGACSVQSHERCKVWRSSESLWLDVLETQPTATTALNNLGHYYLEEVEDLDRARELFERAAAVRPGSPDPVFNLGLVAWRAGDRVEAARQFERSLDIWPGAVTHRVTIATFYAEGGELDRAAAHYRRIVEDMPDSAEAVHNLGDLYRALGQLGRAREAYQRALEIDPDLGPTYAALAGVYLEQGNPQRARELAERARSLGARVPPRLARKLGAAESPSARGR